MLQIFIALMATSGGSHLPSHNLNPFSISLSEYHSILNPVLGIYRDVVKKIPDSPAKEEHYSNYSLCYFSSKNI